MQWDKKAFVTHLTAVGNKNGTPAVDGKSCWRKKTFLLIRAFDAFYVRHFILIYKEKQKKDHIKQRQTISNYYKNITRCFTEVSHTTDMTRVLQTARKAHFTFYLINYSTHTCGETCP